MSWDLKLSARKGDTEQVFIDFERIGYIPEVREFFGRWPNCEEIQIAEFRVKELLEIVYSNLDELSESWRNLFILPYMITDGYKVFIENSY